MAPLGVLVFKGGLKKANLLYKILVLENCSLSLKSPWNLFVWSRTNHDALSQAVIMPIIYYITQSNRLSAVHWPVAQLPSIYIFNVQCDSYLDASNRNSTDCNIFALGFNANWHGRTWYG